MGLIGYLEDEAKKYRKEADEAEKRAEEAEKRAEEAEKENELFKKQIEILRKLKVLTEKGTITDEQKSFFIEASNKALSDKDHSKLDELLSQVVELEQNDSKK